MAQNFQNEEQPDPIQERVGLGMFTDREAEMASLMKWVNLVDQKIGRSRALVSHRRHGKTAIMERLYNRLFWEYDQVMPFYFEISEGVNKISMKDLAEVYLYAFLEQYLAYRTRDATLAFGYQRSFARLRKIAEEIGETIVVDAIDNWVEDDSVSILLKISAVFHDLAHYFASRTGLSIIVMFDEFQRLDQVLYYDEELTRQCHHYTSTFSAAVESSRAPMLLAGSQVTILTQQALAGPMMGRVSVQYIDRLPLTGAVELVLKFAQRHQQEISLELAYTISHMTDGHPYYIWCLFNSHYFESDLTAEVGVRETMTFEIDNRTGHINKFWQLNFLRNMETFDSPYAKDILFYLAQYQEKEVPVEQIIKDLKLPISAAEANQIMRQLIWCDLIRERSRGFYGGLTDPMLARVLRIEYGWEIEQLMRDDAIVQIQAEFVDEMVEAKDALIKKLRGELSTWTGRFAEMFIDKVMKLFFKGQTVDGARYFHRDEKICLSPFKRVYNTVTQPEGAPVPYQIDLYGIPIESAPSPQPLAPWIVEAKNWQRPINKPEAEHFWQAAQNLAEERGHEQVVCWLYSKSGFSGPAKDFLQEKEILYTDHDSLVQLLQDFEVVEQW